MESRPFLMNQQLDVLMSLSSSLDRAVVSKLLKILLVTGELLIHSHSDSRILLRVLFWFSFLWLSYQTSMSAGTFTDKAHWKEAAQISNKCGFQVYSRGNQNEKCDFEYNLSSEKKSRSKAYKFSIQKELEFCIFNVH